MCLTANDWKSLLGRPKNYDFEPTITLLEKYETDRYTDYVDLNNDGIYLGKVGD